MNEASKLLGRHVTRADELTLVEHMALCAAYVEAWIDAWVEVTGLPRPEPGSPLWVKLVHDAVPMDGEEYRFFGLVTRAGRDEQ